MEASLRPQADSEAEETLPIGALSTNCLYLLATEWWHCWGNAASTFSWCAAQWFAGHVICTGCHSCPLKIIGALKDHWVLCGETFGLGMVVGLVTWTRRSIRQEDLWKRERKMDKSHVVTPWKDIGSVAPCQWGFDELRRQSNLQEKEGNWIWRFVVTPSSFEAKGQYQQNQRAIDLVLLPRALKTVHLVD